MSESISGEIAESYTLVPTEEPASSTKRYLTFLSNDLTFGISTEYVSEIIINYKIRPVPMACPLSPFRDSTHTIGGHPPNL